VGKFKKVGIGIVGVLILLIAIGMAVPPQSEDVDDVPSKVQFTSKTYMDSIDNLIPSRADIGTQWELEDKTPFTGDSVDESPAGLIDGVQQHYYHPELPSKLPHSVYVTIYKFDTIENGEKYLAEREAFDYENLTYLSWGDNLSGMNCYGKSGTYLSEDKFAKSLGLSIETGNDMFTITCLEKNIIFNVELNTYFTIDYKDTVKEFAYIINGKI